MKGVEIKNKEKTVKYLSSQSPCGTTSFHASSKEKTEQKTAGIQKTVEQEHEKTQILFPN